MITNNKGVNRRISQVSGIIEHRFMNGDENGNRYGRKGEKAIIKGLIEEMYDTGRIRGGMVNPAEERSADNVENEY